MAKKRRKQNQFPSSENKVPREQKRLTIQARNPKQRDFIRAIRHHDITFGMGSAGTGKTYLASLLAMEKLIDGHIDKIVICRPAVTAGGEELGFLPGGVKDKMDPFIQPIFDAFRSYWSPNTIRQYIADQVIEIVPLAYMRGRSFARSFIICDEAQNATPGNLLMLLSRLGEDSKMVITGDPIQSDINGDSCFHIAKSILHSIDEIDFVHFTNKDVVRHPTVAKILNVWPNNGIDEEGGEVANLPSFVTKSAVA